MYVCLLKWGCFPLCQEKIFDIIYYVILTVREALLSQSVPLSSPCIMAFCTMVWGCTVIQLIVMEGWFLAR